MADPVLDPFLDELPDPWDAVLQPHKVDGDGTRYYRIEVREGKRKLHAQLPPTPFWGYDGKYPGPILVVPRDKKVVVEFVNNLPAPDPAPEPRSRWPFHIPADPPGAPANPHLFTPEKPWTVVHLHGSPTAADSDGWTDNAYFPGGSAVHHYPPQGSAALLWYHDHAHMITRLNVYAGLAGLYLVRDEAAEVGKNLPVGRPFEIPLVIQDRNFEVQDGAHTGRFKYLRLRANSQFRGTYILVNGVVWPFINVRPGVYRLRILNGSNARTYRLRLRLPGREPDTARMQQVGVDGGFLHDPVRHPGVTAWDGENWVEEKALVLAPAERADVLVDLTGFPADQVTAVDLIDGGSAAVMQFRVQPGPAAPVPEVSGPLPRSARLSRGTPESAAAPSVRRSVGLFPIPFGGGPAMQTINGRLFHEAVEDAVVLGAVEEWEFLNFIDEEHPMHIHLCNFEVLDRQPFTGPDLTGGAPKEFVDAFRAWQALPATVRPPLPPECSFTGPAQPADPNEKSPKDTVRAPGFHVTRVRAEFKYHTGMYMYHCHILEHEDMDMMRPLLVVPRGMHLMTGPLPHHDHDHDHGGHGH